MDVFLVENNVKNNDVVNGLLYVGQHVEPVSISRQSYSAWLSRRWPIQQVLVCLLLTKI